ncbi:MBL fold metallo-hydrolase [Deinococcus cavernae]|nr:MBL fold metallo-hydrolase [Deinococcus cavernae]
MQLTFLGTGADSAYPLAFCACEICRVAREKGGKNLRRRSSAALDADLLIDLGPDSIQAMLHFGLNPAGLRFLLQTHPHHDHFDQNHLATRISEYRGRMAQPLEIVASRGTLHRMTSMLQGMGFDGDLLKAKSHAELNISVQVIEHGQTLQLGQRRVTAFTANHDSSAECLIYAVEQGQSSLLYATDTDSLPEETLQAIRRADLTFSTVVLDHTYGPGCNGGGHLNAARFQHTIDRFRHQGVLREKAKIYATHLSHEGNMEHDQLTRYAARHGYTIPWDGLGITL